jgi:hypothetical protein
VRSRRAYDSDAIDADEGHAEEDVDKAEDYGRVADEPVDHVREHRRSFTIRLEHLRMHITILRWCNRKKQKDGEIERGREIKRERHACLIGEVAEETLDEGENKYEQANQFVRVVEVAGLRRQARQQTRQTPAGHDEEGTS